MIALLVVIGWQLLNSIIRDLFTFLVLGPWRNLNSDVTVESLHCQFGTQDCLPNIQEQICVYIGPLTFKVAMVANLYMNN